jgi:uncharacterized membrane protein YeaQ/YmgE (transglycosylase-associated protein family)
MGPMANTQTGNRTKRRSRRSLAPRLPVRVIVDWDAVAKIDKQALVAQVGIGLVAGWLASWLVGGNGLVRYALTGMIGSFLGAIFLERLGIDLGVRNDLARRIATATIGAVLVILAARLLA